jgi:biotin synthase
MKQLQQAGVNQVCIAIDVATEKIFKKTKGIEGGGPYNWKKHHETLKEAVNVFGKDFVTTHLIAGLGETEEEMCQKIQWCVDSGIYPALFAFTPIRGTAFEKMHQPQIGSYRRIQVAHFLLTQEKINLKTMKFECKGKITDFGVADEDLMKIIETGDPFRTSGCPECNRPYYNEKPRGPFYNYPRSLTLKEIEKEKKIMGF